MSNHMLLKKDTIFVTLKNVKIWVSNLIINSMNKSADPCNDFYNYACGSWPINYPVPEGKLMWNLGGNITNYIEASLIKILQEESKSEDNIPLSIEKKLFKACMDEDRIEQKGLEGLSKIIESLGGWPLVMSHEKWNEKDFPWQKVAKGYMEYSTAIPLFTIGISPDSQNSSITLISLQEPKNSFLNKQIIDDLLKSLDTANNVNKFSELNAMEFIFRLPLFYANYIKYNIDDSIFVKKISKMIHFLNGLKLIKSPLSNYGENQAEQKMTISEFQKYYNRNKSQKSTTKIDWLEIVRTLMKNTNINIDENEQIVIGDKLYFDKLFVLLDVTSHETIVNYLHWHFSLTTLAYLNNEGRQLMAEYRKITTGITPKKEERSVECVTQQILNHGVINEYLKRNFPKNISVPIRNIAEDIRKEMDNVILQTSWMDRKTKLLAKEKLKAMKVKTGYPEYYDDEKKFNEIYDGFEISEDHFENFMRILEFIKLESLKKLREPFKKDVWFMSPLTVNAYYFPAGNSLTIPAAQLSIPVYSTNWGLMSANYGSVGFIVGHEMSHGFDMLGYKYDKNGNVIPWWSDKVVTDFKTKADCFIKQYDNYGVNGKLTQSENIADSSGLNAAYSAFIKKANKIREFKLPNLENITRKQLFFLNFANTFCHSTTDFFERTVEKDVHTKISLRINGAVANVKGFAEAFQCSKESHLNPRERCIIWE
ncbi:endothelin-converting enzyme 1-like isoform X2 [Leptopilina boulardi]|uniref:endothelin-converting enzyme 1-like isoform X2 n=1 Tax=Leptopilina boulardi TaxID=63433 RepID=UPI0021F64158|nr:endothelin-converting enzyme 1-like isoform X2 [Leptopilina boulardi]